MPKIFYANQRKRWTEEMLLQVAQAERICRDYEEQGYDLTLRQLYYQFVARGWLSNSQRNYERLGNLIADARMAGKLDWNYIVDRTRNLRGLRRWDSPQEIVSEMAESYRNEKWRSQPIRIEAWIEKDALAGVLQTACNPLDVDWFSCRGYTSVSEVWGAAQRLRRYIEQGQRVVILHLGDHDPSGCDMSRDILDRLSLFLATDFYNGRSKIKLSASEAVQFVSERFEVRRIALNMNQIEELNPPPNPTKFKDPRAKRYIEQYGYESWELDALPPEVLVGLITDHVVSLRDDEKWQAALAKERADKKLLDAVAKRWADVKKFITWKPKKKETTT